MTRYLTVAEVIAIHDEIMLRTGHAPQAVRDEGLLESALMRGRVAGYYEQAGVIRQAVLMAFGISQNQPFIDGNKRAAIGTLDIFLRINGYRFTGNPVELAQKLEAVAAPQRNLEAEAVEFEAWLADRTDQR